ncbi:MAG: AMP-binding protein [Bauldia sp.]
MFDPEVETASWAEQQRADDPAYRRQIAYLFANSRFYRGKLSDAGFKTPEAVGGINGIARLPFTEKDELRTTRSEADPIGTHLAAPMDKVVRIFSTSGTTGTPSFVPLTAEDLSDWIRISCRSYSASGIRRGDRLVSTYGAGPFVAGVTLDAFNALGLTHIPVGAGAAGFAGNTDRLLTAVRLLKADAVALTPSYALYLAEWASERHIDLAGSSVKRLLVAGEPGGGEPTMRAKLDAAWGAQVTEAMGIGDIAVSLWGECSERKGMHFSGRGLVHFELIDPETGEDVPLEDGAEGELVYSHLRHRAAPLLRFRSRDQVRVWTSQCACGRTAPRVRCIGRTDDMLIVRGINLFPTALREIVNEFQPSVSGVVSVRPGKQGFRQDPPLKVLVELAVAAGSPELAERIRMRVREALIVTTEIVLVPQGALPRSSYKSPLVDWSEAADRDE